MAQATEHIIDLAHVEKTYKGKIRALQGIEMRVRPGEIFGLLGPNGAGKSTLVKILMTVIHATRCRGTLLGRRVGDKRTLREVGYLPEHHQFPPYLKGREVLDFFGALAGTPRAQRRRRADELLEITGMTDWANTPVGRYSKGMRQRVGIAQALISDPKLVLLDEPTDGVDPQGRRDIRALCERMRDEGRTVFINSHLLSELEMLCDRVAILVKGRVQMQGTIQELTAGQRRHEIEIAGEPADAQKQLEAAAKAAGSVSKAPPLEPKIAGPVMAIPTDDPAAIQPVIAKLVHDGAVIKRVAHVRPSLEDLFMAAVDGDAPGAARGSKKGAAS